MLILPLLRRTMEQETERRIKKGTKQAFALSILFCIFISALVFIFAGQLMGIFVSKAETEVIACGIKYLR